METKLEDFIVKRSNIPKEFYKTIRKRIFK